MESPGSWLVRIFGIFGINQDQPIERDQKRSPTEPNGDCVHRVERNNLTHFAGSHQIRRPKHRHRIGRLEEGKWLLQAQPIANRYRHLNWAGSALSSRMGRVDGLM